MSRTPDSLSPRVFRSAAAGFPVPLRVFLVAGERAKGTLAGWKDWAALHDAVVVAVLCFVIGLKLLGDGIGRLARARYRDLRAPPNRRVRPGAGTARRTLPRSAAAVLPDGRS
ncbi:GAP family protein [Streptomyces sp. NPDC058206]|uniref:GAP family protein n=1 Tax=Streptomyces sp. NPDC058206 TaxID=3346382 RepID=UPI0036E021DD